ncbi:MAG: hypothetical protein AAF517_05470 [Planctomycetota bacterium]
MRFTALTFLALLSTAAASAAPRDVQIRAIDFDDGTIELRNYGDGNEDLDGWRFCTHDENRRRVYSSTSGLNGVSIAAGESLFIRFANDADEPNEINASTVGAFASPISVRAYAMQLYFAPVSFGDGDTIADHVQWSLNGVDDESADDRSDEAEDGGVWTDQSAWVPTSDNTFRIMLNDDVAGDVLHGPNSYSSDVREEPAPVFHRGDADDDGQLNLTDGIVIFNFLFLGGSAPPCLEAANANSDDAVDLSDGIFLLNFLFLGGPQPGPPGPPSEPCSFEPMALTCEDYQSCF